MKRREKELERERESLEREVNGKRECTGRRGFESETRGSQTRESRRVDATNAGFDTRVQDRDEKNTDAVISSASC